MRTIKPIAIYLPQFHPFLKMIYGGESLQSGQMFPKPNLV
jgi:hypothetical protein